MAAFAGQRGAADHDSREAHPLRGPAAGNVGHRPQRKEAVGVGQHGSGRFQGDMDGFQGGVDGSGSSGAGHRGQQEPGV